MGVTGGCRRDNRKSSAPEVLTLPHQTKNLGHLPGLRGWGCPEAHRAFSIRALGWGTGYFSGWSQGLHIGEKKKTSFYQAAFEEWQQCDIAGVRSLGRCQKGKEAEPVPWSVVFKAT